jgi:hypothetical protein
LVLLGKEVERAFAVPVARLGMRNEQRPKRSGRRLSGRENAMTEAECQAEIQRLHEFILILASKLANAAEVLAVKAERRDRRNES